MNRFRPLEDPTPLQEMLPMIAFLGGLSEAQLAILYPSFETATFTAGAYISRCGDTPTHIHIIRSGKVALFIHDGDRTIRKRTFQSGDCFGEAALLSLINDSASFLAEEPTELIAFSRRALNQLHRDEPKIFSQILLNLARDLARKLQYTDLILVRGEK